MKGILPYFMIGAFLALFVAGVVQSQGTETTANRSPGSLKTPVPTSIDLDQALIQKQEELTAKEQRLLQWEDRLKVEEERLRARIEELTALQARQDIWRKESEERQKIITERLVKTYETMAPKKAAEVVAVMDDPLAVELLMAIKPKTVAQILDKMDSNRAMILSTKIAERRPASVQALEPNK